MKESKKPNRCFVSLLALLLAGGAFAPLASLASEVSVGYQYDMRGQCCPQRQRRMSQDIKVESDRCH